MIAYDQELKIYYSTLINDGNYFSGFSTKEAGDGRAKETISGFFDENDIEFKNIISLEQIHSANIEIYDSLLSNEDRIPETDGVITKDVKVPLTIQTADCVPIVYVDKKSGLIGISHNGWRGSLKKLQIRMIEQFIEHGSNLDHIKIALGPAIGDCCYEIKDDLYYSFLDELEEYSKKVFRMRGGRKYLNLTLLNYLMLLDKGVKKENLDFFPFCTKCNAEKFFSHRREGKDLKGKMFSFVIKKGNIT